MAGRSPSTSPASPVARLKPAGLALRPAGLALRPAGLVLAALLLVAAGCDHPRVAPMPVAKAQADRTPRKVRILKVWDQGENRLGNGGESFVTHYIEVEVLPRRTEEPERLTLPFDEYTTGHAPPEVGSEPVVAPADWVARDPRSLMRWQSETTKP